MRSAARSFGFIDPARFMARLRKFGQPSEYDMPLEIVRNAVVFHSRGLINTRAIQNNLDWVWPYWIERQFDPRDVSFLPRSANVSHINLTHRNWTAVGLPDLALYPLVDPRGLITPLHDGWSIDAWIVPKTGSPLVPSRLMSIEQSLDPSTQGVVTASESNGLRLHSRVQLVFEEHEPVLKVHYTGESAQPADLVVSLRPYNTEGIQFIDTIETLPDRHGWLVNRQQEVRFDLAADHVVHSNYAEGDVFHRLAETKDTAATCPVGMATGAACFTMAPRQPCAVTVQVPLGKEARREHGPRWGARTWPEARHGLAALSVPDARYRAIYEASVNTLLHLSAGKVYPGPYTYRRFWFRDASLMLEALAQLGAIERVRAQLATFPALQKHDGYFESQEGEWDSNGEVLWAFGRFAELTGERFPEEWCNAIERGAQWLQRRRLPDGEQPHAGLLPAGFSAEHFGPNDYYYWDDYWAIGGLRAVAPHLERVNRLRGAAFCRRLAQAFSTAVERSLEKFAVPRGKGAIPASPYRRMDSGAIGVLVADYPLQLYPAADARIEKTLEHFLAHHFVNGGFFQDMTHSGVNVYLTLAIAQSLLRAGDPRWQEIIRQVARDASPTGLWPEAIHPLTGGGCIGDGQHGWAAAEWFRWTRAAFVREENDELIIGSGLLPEWLEAREPLSFGLTPTPWGPVRVELRPTGAQSWSVRVEGTWREGKPPRLSLSLGNRERRPLTPGAENRVEALDLCEKS